MNSLRLTLIVSMVLFSAAEPAVAADIIWTDTNTDQILRGPTDGDGPISVLFDISDYPDLPASISPRGVAVQGSHVYWADSETGQILRGAVDGSGTIDALFDITDYMGSPSEIRPMTVAVQGECVYWIDDRIDQILRGAADGSSSATTLFVDPGSSGVAADDNYVYWTNPIDGIEEILRGAADGSGAASVLYDVSDHTSPPPNFQPKGLAIDRGFLYWTTKFEIARAAADGSSSISVLFTTNDYPGGYIPLSVTVDGSSVYWTDFTTDQILRGAIDGSGAVSVLYDISDYPGSPGSINPAWIALALPTADTDFDGDIDTADLTTMFQNFTGSAGSGRAIADGDTDFDGDVDTADITIGFQDFTGSQAITVPEPASFVLVAMGIFSLALFQSRMSYESL